MHYTITQYIIVMKKGFYIVTFILFSTSIYSQDSQLGLRLHSGFNNYTNIGLGIGAHYLLNTTETSSFRFIIEGDILFLDESSPIVQKDDLLMQLQSKLQFLFFTSAERLYYGGVGVVYSIFEAQGSDMAAETPSGYLTSEQLNSSFGVDLFMGFRVNELISFEMDYVFIKPELTWEIYPYSGEDSYNESKKINLSTLYINLIFSF